MDNVYKELARVLDRIPNGFPETESGVELKILAKLFTPKQAKLACRLTLEPQNSKSITQKFDSDEHETFATLKGMVKKGLIEAERGQGGLAFKLMPFIVGFYERQNAQIDEEFAHLFETYYKEALHKMMAVKPSVHRIIPIEKTIPLDIEVMPYGRASNYIKNAKAWGVLPCICRVQRRLIGQGCSHTEENCIVFHSKPGAFDRTETIRTITKEEALEILADADEEGLVHSTGNAQEGLTYICNCCTCSCGILRGMAEYGHLNAVGRSDFFAAVDETLCTGCTTCVDRCQFNALEVRESDEVCIVERQRCYGCGLCVSTCPTGALYLEHKPADEIESPPLSESTWREERARARK